MRTWKRWQREAELQRQRAVDAERSRDEWKQLATERTDEVIDLMVRLEAAEQKVDRG